MIDYWMNNLLDFHTKNETVDVEIMGYSYFENKFLEEEDREEEDMLKELSKRVFIVDEAHHYRNMSVNMQRALQKYLEEPLAEKVLDGSLKEGDELKVDYVKDAEELAIGLAKAMKLPKPKKEIKE
jgi:hypothetical protein